MPVAKGYPKAVKYKGRRMYIMHRGGKRYTAQQLKAYYATSGWSRSVKKRRKRRKKRL